jgi:hypothetical protein
MVEQAIYSMASGYAIDPPDSGPSLLADVIIIGFQREIYNSLATHFDIVCEQQ